MAVPRSSSCCNRPWNCCDSLTVVVSGENQTKARQDKARDTLSQFRRVLRAGCLLRPSKGEGIRDGGEGGWMKCRDFSAAYN